MGVQFSKQQIDHHVEAVRVFVQAPIDAKADRIHLQEFYNRVSEQQPRLFGSLAQEPGSFAIKKQLVIPGKGRLGVTTFFLTPSGPVFSFPHRLPFTHDEIRWSDNNLNDEIISSLETLRSCHATWKYFQVTKRREVIFTTRSEPSSDTIRQRFAMGIPDHVHDVGVRWNDRDELYERRITLTAVERRVVSQESVAGMQYQRESPEPEYGVQVVLEVANRKLSAMSSEAIRIVLGHADEYYQDTLLPSLRGEDDEYRQ